MSRYPSAVEAGTSRQRDMSRSYVNYLAVTQRFTHAIAQAGLTPPDHVKADGRLHRFSNNGKRGDDAGYYVLHLDGLPAGLFGCWRLGLNQAWQAEPKQALTPEQERVHRARLQAMARERAAALWCASLPASPRHRYLVAKGIQPHGVRTDRGQLVLPVRSASGELHSLQFISPSGDKRFLTGGRVSGRYFSIGKPEGTVCIAEGFATAASIHEATGHAVAVAFNAGNLGPVAQALRTRFPELRLILCATLAAQKNGPIVAQKSGPFLCAV
jgi:putative DNA primase/helicase